MIDNHCVSLEIAKELKEAGWEKKTEFWWLNEEEVVANAFQFEDLVRGSGSAFYNEKQHKQHKKLKKSWNNRYSAPLATEILEELPDDYILLERKKGGGWSISKGTKDFVHTEKALNLCDCAAKMWIYLKKEGLIK